MQGIQREECDNCGKTLTGVAGSRLSCPVCKTPHTFSEPADEPPEPEEEAVEEDEPTGPGPNDRIVVKRRK